MKKLNVRILATLLGISFILNLLFFQGCVNPPNEVKSLKAILASKTLICDDTIGMGVAKKWIGTVNTSSIRFNNKSIFICSDVINAMAALPDFAGIWVRRGISDDSIIHDIAWVLQTGMPAPSTAYLLEWRSCVCEPCCGSDSADYRDYSTVYSTVITH
jgi:hypothetical protein